MQFRTSSGGVEVGSAIVDAQGNVSVTGYWPYGSIGQGTGAFNIGNFDASTFHADPSGTFLTIAENNGTSDYVFGTPNGIFAVDTPNGAILGLKKAASKNFDASFAGTYKAIYYQKTGANTGPNNTETGTASLGNATLAITSGRQITISDSQGSILVVATLQPVADTSYLYGQGELGDPCNGLFTFRLITSGFQQDVFVTISARRLRHIYGPSDSVLLIPRHPALGVWEHLRLSVRRRIEMSRTTNEHSSTCLPTLTKKRRNLSLDSSASLED